VEDFRARRLQHAPSGTLAGPGSRPRRHRARFRVFPRRCQYSSANS